MNTYVVRSTQSVVHSGVTWKQEAVAKIDSDNSAIETANGNRYTYNFLVVCPGLQLRFDQIEGATEALNDPNSPVGSIYKFEYAKKASVLRENFKGGKAVFTLPTLPIKCGGAP